MKKLILLTSILLLGITRSFGQAIKLGVLGGPNLSTFEDVQPAEAESASAIVGVHAGIFTDIKLGNWLIEPGLFYESIGGTNNFGAAPPDGGTASYTYTVQYLQLPLNLLYSAPGSKFFFGGGPYIAFGLSAWEKGSINGGAFSGGNFMQSIDQKFAFPEGDNPDFSFDLMAGVHLEGGTILTLGYGLGLTSSSNNSAMRNSVFSISIGHSIF